jgi:hypothetical protein
MQRRALRQSRSDVLWAIGGLVVFQAGLALAIAWWLPELRDPAYAWKARVLARRVAAEADRRPFTLVMVGTSRTAYGLDGKRLEARYGPELNRPLIVYNFGISAGGAVTSLLTLRRLLDEGVRPDHLLIEVMPAFLAGQPGVEGETRWLSPTRLLRDEVAQVSRLGMDPDKAHHGWLRSCLAPAYAHRFKIVSFITPRWLPLSLRQDWVLGTDASGWRPFLIHAPTTEERLHRVERSHEEYAPYLTDFQLGGHTGEAFRELLTLCRAQSIPATLVLMPEGTRFRSWYTPEAWAQIESFLAGLSAEFRVPLVNARDWVPDEGFSDDHHMIQSGAEIFTDRLGREVVAPICRSELKKKGTADKRR